MVGKAPDRCHLGQCKRLATVLCLTCRLGYCRDHWERRVRALHERIHAETRQAR